MGETFVWWLTLELLGLIALPISALSLRALPDRGYTVSKTLGLLLTVWLAYTLSMMQLAQFGRGLLFIAGIVVAAFSGWLLWRRGHQLWFEGRTWLSGRANLRYILASELLFTLMFALWALLRAYSPDIFGTEKFMDFGFLNSIVKSPTFPPNDPWLAGFPINYYYFGYVLMAGLTLLSGVPTEIGYNLASATIPALTAMGAFGFTVNLIRSTLLNRADSLEAGADTSAALVPRRRVRAAVVFPAQADLPVRRSHRVSASRSTTAVIERELTVVPTSAASTRITKSNGRQEAESLDGNNGEKEIVKPEPPYYDLPPDTPAGRPLPAFLSPYLFGLLAALMVVAMGHITTLFAVKSLDSVSSQNGNGWHFCLMCQKVETFSWWDPSRVIKDMRTTSAPGKPPTKQADIDSINEFPAFSFLLADMHPHVMALPLWFLALASAFALTRRKVRRALSWRDGLPSEMGGWLTILLAGLVIGSLYTTNTWDYPTYLLIALAGITLPYLAFRHASTKKLGYRWLLPVIVQGFIIIVWSFLSFLLFHLTFKSLVGGQPAEIPPNLANIPVLGWLLQKAGSLVLLNTWDKGIAGFLVIFGIFLLGILGWLGYEAVRDIRRSAESGRTRQPWLVLGATVVLLLLIAVLLRFPMLAFALPLGVVALLLVWREPALLERNFVLVMVGLASLIAFVIEIVFLRDVFNSRQNTIFKFYYQIWVLYALAAAYGVWRVLTAAWQKRESRQEAASGVPSLAGKAVSAVWATVFGLLVLSGLMYTVYGGLQRMSGGPGPTGLDGMAHFKNSAPGDYVALNWLKQNASGAQRVLECCHDEYNVGNHVGRVSSYTGVPTLISWDGHEYQWRGGQPDVLPQLGARRQVVTSLYTAANGMTGQQMLNLLQENQIDYVFVGAVERGAPGAAGSFPDERLTQAAEALYKQVLSPVFTSGDTVVYRVPPATSSGLSGNRP